MENQSLPKKYIYILYKLYHKIASLALQNNSGNINCANMCIGKKIA